MCERRPRATVLFTGNDFFTQPGQRYGDLDGGAGLRAFTERELLVDHGQDASAGGINGDDGAVHVAQSFNRGLAHDGIFAFNDVAVCIVVTKRVAGEALNIAMAQPRAAQCGRLFCSGAFGCCAGGDKLGGRT